jgi:5'-nucleotidase
VDFLARGGDGYRFPADQEFTVIGTSYQQALADHVATDLGGVISAADYPAGGEGRITFTP